MCIRDRLSQGSAFFRLGSRIPTDDHSKIAYAVDRVGRRLYDIEIKDVNRGAVNRGITGTSGSMQWSKRGDYLFYVKRDPDTLRAYQVWRHRTNTPARMDRLVFEEKDDTFSCDIKRSSSGEYLMIESRQTLTTETHLLRADDPTGEWQVVLPRETGHEYHVHPVGERLFIRTNKSAENFKVVIAPLSVPARWTDLLRNRPDVLIEGLTHFKGHFVVRERRGGLIRLRVYPSSVEAGFLPFEIPFDDPVYTVALTGNEEFDTNKIRYRYSSMNQPASIIEYDLERNEADVLKVQGVGGGFSTSNYVSKRVFAEARDGAQVPISLVYRKDRAARPGPVLLYGYGSYGFSQDVRFDEPVISLLDLSLIHI